MLKKLWVVIPALALGVFASVPAYSTIVLGLNGDAEVGTDLISFGVYPTGAPYTPAPGFGTYEISAPVTDIFAANGVFPGEMGMIQSLNDATEPGGVVLSTPVKFLTFNSTGSNLQLFLTELFVGNVPAPPAPPNSPINLYNTPTGAEATVAFMGYVLNTTTSVETPYSGLFSATFSGTSESSLLSSLPIDTPFSGTISLTPMTATPEPASLLLMGLGLLGAGVLARKKAIRK